MPTPAEKLERLESLLARIRTRARLPTDELREPLATDDDAHPLRGTDPGIASARRTSPRRLEISAHSTDPQMDVARPAHSRLELPMPAPIPVSDVAPTHPLPARRPEPPAPEPQRPAEPAPRPISSAPPRGPLATPLPPAMPGLFIPPTKSLLMGRPRLDSTPPPPHAQTEPLPRAASPHDDDALGLEPDTLAQAPIEEAPVAAHRVVRVASRPPERAPPLSAPAPEPERPLAPSVGVAPASRVNPGVPHPVVPLPPSMRAEAAPASAARALAIEAKRGRGGWWVASFVFLLFVAALIALRHFGLLPTAPP